MTIPFLIYINLHVTTLLALNGIPHSQTTPVLLKSSKPRSDILHLVTCSCPTLALTLTGVSSGLLNTAPLLQNTTDLWISLWHNPKQSQGHGPWCGVGVHVALAD